MKIHHPHPRKTNTPTSAATDRTTGVRPWFKPFDVGHGSPVGIGKKGGY